MPWAPDYCTLSEAKAYVKIDDTFDDAQLALAITAASRTVDGECDRQFGQTTAEPRAYTARWARRRALGQGRWIVEHDDIGDIAGLTVAVAAGAIDAFELEPVNALKEGRPYEQLVVKPESTHRPLGGENEVTITATFGWTAVPTTVKQATLLQASRFFSRRTSPYGIAGSPELGSELRLLVKADPDVAVMLRKAHLVRWWAAA